LTTGFLDGVFVITGLYSTNINEKKVTAQYMAFRFHV